MKNFKTQREIYEHLVSGGKISSEARGQMYYFLDDSGKIVNDAGFAISFEFSKPEYWYKYELPKKKKKVAQYCYKGAYGKYLDTNYYYENQAQAKLDYPSASSLIRLDHTEIEVDDE